MGNRGVLCRPGWGGKGAHPPGPSLGEGRGSESRYHQRLPLWPTVWPPDHGEYGALMAPGSSFFTVEERRHVAEDVVGW